MSLVTSNYVTMTLQFMLSIIMHKCLQYFKRLLSSTFSEILIARINTGGRYDKNMKRLFLKRGYYKMSNFTS